MLLIVLMQRSITAQKDTDRKSTGKDNNKLVLKKNLIVIMQTFWKRKKYK